MPREGIGLLQGRVICGVCGKRMRVRYQKVTTTLEPYYVCQDTAAHQAGKPCQSIRGRAVDAAINSLLLETVAPAAIEVALAVEDEIAGRVEQANVMRLKQLERGRYDAELARRRYINVDPANRMVADAIEADWNSRLRKLDELQQEHDRQRRTTRACSVKKHARASGLSPTTSPPSGMTAESNRLRASACLAWILKMSRL
jgi:hypothetical protein